MKPVVLTILDGYGIRNEEYGNAIALSNNKVFENLWNSYPHTTLTASGQQVGLPKGQMGNSEVGHMNIGAGRIVYQPLELINKSIEENSFYQNKQLLEVMNHVKQNKSSLHILGLLSDGGVHSHINHLFAIIEMCKKEKIEKVYYHVFLDGRDTLPNEKEKYLTMLNNKINESGIGKIATVSGRYYAMDRDNRWDRVELAYKAIVYGEGEQFNNYLDLVKSTNDRNITDEFVIPAVLDKNGIINDNDGLVTFNFRPDRLKELFSALTNKEFSSFETKNLENIKLVTMMNVSDEVICKSAFELEKLKNTLGEYVSNLGKKQLRIAETEKYAHVTYFFDGGVEKNLPNCKKKLIPSPKVTTYDLKPSMSVEDVTDELLKEIEDYDLVILNFANGDMVGHTGSLKAAILAVEAMDYQLEKIYKRVKNLDGVLIVTADHGNCEEMLDDKGNILTAHTTNPVPFIITMNNIILKEGKLGDIAPTILEIMNIEKPSEMTGDSLIKNKEE